MCHTVSYVVTNESPCCVRYRSGDALICHFFDHGFNRNGYKASVRASARVRLWADFLRYRPILQSSILIPILSTKYKPTPRHSTFKITTSGFSTAITSFNLLILFPITVGISNLIIFAPKISWLNNFTASMAGFIFSAKGDQIRSLIFSFFLLKMPILTLK